MIKKIVNFVKENKIFEYGDSVILGVSGGADSMCMLYVLKELDQAFGLTLNVVHVNHHIRGVEAQKDADFVKSVCRKLGVEFEQADADIPEMVRDSGMSEEEAGRKARYQAFYDAALRKKANKIAVAHNLNDNSETILFHLFRGTGIKGLTGIPVRREMIVRPLLCCTRREIEEYLCSIGAEYRTDATNNITEYSRNKIRLEVLPYIRENINRRAEYNIVNAAEHLEEISDFMNKETIKAYDEYVEDDVFLELGFGIHPAVMSQVFRFMIYNEVGKLKDITRTHIKSVAALKEMPVSKSVNLPYNLTAVRTYEGIQIRKNINEKKNSHKEEILIEDGKIFEHGLFNISLEKEAFNIENIEELVYTKWFDYDKIHKLALRNRQKGDYIIIDEKGHRKKLKDYFINEKIPRDQRDDILLLADGSHVVWVIGHRISSFYKVTEDASKILKITYIGQQAKDEE